MTLNKVTSKAMHNELGKTSATSGTHDEEFGLTWDNDFEVSSDSPEKFLRTMGKHRPIGGSRTSSCCALTSISATAGSVDRLKSRRWLLRSGQVGR